MSHTTPCIHAEQRFAYEAFATGFGEGERLPVKYFFLLWMLEWQMNGHGVLYCEEASLFSTWPYARGWKSFPRRSTIAETYPLRGHLVGV